jgi:hypothetical protein
VNPGQLLAAADRRNRHGLTFEIGEGLEFRPGRKPEERALVIDREHFHRQTLDDAANRRSHDVDCLDITGDRSGDGGGAARENQLRRQRLLFEESLIQGDKGQDRRDRAAGVADANAIVRLGAKSTATEQQRAQKEFHRSLPFGN